jgi:hypothetical protein
VCVGCKLQCCLLIMLWFAIAAGVPASWLQQRLQEHLALVINVCHKTLPTLHYIVLLSFAYTWQLGGMRGV